MLSTRFKPDEIKILELGETCEVFYVPRWLPFKHALSLYDSLSKKINFQQYKIAIADTLVDQPRLTCWFGEQSYTYSGLAIQPEPWLPELLTIRNKLIQDLGENFNSALANYYENGSHYVGWHADDESQIGSTIASVSLGEVRDFSIRSAKANHTLSLQAGSLLVMAGETQKYCKHTLHKTAKDVKPRINLTYRQFQNQRLTT